MPFFISWLFNIPVSFRDMFDRPFPEGEIGQKLDGDAAMPPTAVDGRWAFLNPIRNAVLATFVWNEYSVLDVGSAAEKGVYLVFGDGAVMPRQIFTRFIMVKHGREACRFTIVDAHGVEVPYLVVERGDSRQAIDAAFLLKKQDFERDGLQRDQLAKALNEISAHELYTFV